LPVKVKSGTVGVAKLSMGLTLATPAIVLRAWPYGDADKVVCFLTESYGKLRGIAKGAKRSRKRFANSLEPCSVVTLRFQDRPNGALVFISSADLIFAFKTLDADLAKITLASYLVEITDGLVVERDSNVHIYQHLKTALMLLENGNACSLEFLTRYELKLLRLTGYEPALHGCKRCAAKCEQAAAWRWHFSLPEGGLFCSACAPSSRETLPIGGMALRMLAGLQREDAGYTVSEPLPDGLPAQVVREIRFLMQRLLQFHMEREIRSAAFLSKFVAL
jgi:DNA repair protein RecO (recombination protein O)